MLGFGASVLTPGIGAIVLCPGIGGLKVGIIPIIHENSLCTK